MVQLADVQAEKALKVEVKQEKVEEKKASRSVRLWVQ